MLIPAGQGGTWTFGTNSDDGLRLRIDGQTVINDDSLHAPQNRFGQANLTAGPHALELVFFERGGGAEVELFAAKGSYTTFNANAFDLVGDVANGGLAVETIPGSLETSSGYGAVIETDVQSTMYDTVPGVYARIPFAGFDTSQVDSLTLRMRYDDGYVAYLNGVEIARRNAPAAPAYNSTATVDRKDSDALLVEDVDISQHVGLINSSGINILAVHGLNDAVDSDEFLIIAELADVTVDDSASVYFLEPTPGSFNSTVGVEGFLIDEIEFSHPHGFYDSAFEMSIDAVTDGTSIRYTTDGTEPTATNGFDYTGPITINKTSTIRARAFQDELDPSNVATVTYLFLDDVVRQSPTGTPPSGFPSSTNINGQVLDYGMDPAIVNNGTWGPQLEAALKQVPSVSLVMDIDDLLSSSTGIYTHAQNHGIAWERPISMELINPDGSEGFSVNAGLRIRGGYSRSGNNPKHAFRLFFRDEYGASKLDFPLFGDEGADEFDKIDLRTTQNYSWSFGGDGRNAFVRDVFSRDLQGDMGQPYTRSRYYHLYINGQYWGLYQTQERAEAAYAASYFGGQQEDYDVVKSAGSSGGYQNEATDGTLEAYQRLANFFYQAGGLSDANLDDYWRAQGMNPDGTRNPDFERLLDVDNLIDYMMLTYYTSDADGPGSKFTRPRVNNYFGIFNRENPDGFQFFEHDSEHSLDTGNAAGANYNMVQPLTTGGSQFIYFNPHWMHERLAETNAEYRQQFADRVYEMLFNDGLLTPENAKAVIDARAAEFDLAMIAESARWGDSKRSTPYTQTNWRNAVSSARNWIDNRTPVVLGQLRDQGWYSDTNPPMFTINDVPAHGGTLEPGDEVSMFTTSSTTYTTILPAESTWKYLDNGSNQGTAWRTTDFNDSGWASGRAELGYGDGGENTEIDFGPNSGDKYPTTYFRKTFNVTDVASFQTLRIRLRRDDGAIVYLNGQEVVRSNMPGGTVTYRDYASGTVGGGDESTFFEFEIDRTSLQNGENLLAVEVHQGNGSSSDLSFDLVLEAGVLNTGGSNIYYTLDGSDPRAPGGGMSDQAIPFDGNAFPLDRTTVIKARVRGGSDWSALAVAQFLVDPPATAETLAITEINYHPHDALPQFGDADVDNGEFEFVELMNISDHRIDLTDVAFVPAPNGENVEGIEFRFATQTLEPGERIVVVHNRTAFASRYGTSVRIAERDGVAEGTGVFDGGLSNSGEQLTLVDATGEIIQQFEYNDGGKWPGRADGSGSTLEVEDVSSDYNQPGNWRSSVDFGGSPATAGLGRYSDIVINEILTHTDIPQVDAIELLNTTSQPVDLGGWYISDSGNNYFRYQISMVGGVLPAGGYRVFDETELGFGFRGQESDDAWLLAADTTGKPTRFADHVGFSATQNGVSLGRWSNGVGKLFPMVDNSFGEENAGPFFDDIVLGEIHYHAAEPPLGSTITRDELDFVELYNRSGGAIDIGYWRLDNAVDYAFEEGTMLGAGERFVIVSFDPAAAPDLAAEFRQIYGMAASAKMFGPYIGELDNGGEELQLERPEDLTQIGLGFVLVDRADYSDQDPWPPAADGLGKSLHRKMPVEYGDFAASWTATDPSPGDSETTENNPPVAVDDSYVVAEGGTLNQAVPGVLENDSDADDDLLTVMLVNGTEHGQLTLSPDGSFLYQHDGSETLSDSFTYEASDGRGGTDTAVVTISITPVNDPPEARNDSYSLNEGAQLIIVAPGVLENDRDAEGDALTSLLVDGPQHGTLSLRADGGFTYTHDGGQSLLDQFTYRANDGTDSSAIATVQLNILPVNDPPTAVDDQYSLDEGGALTVTAPGLLDNDTDLDGDTLVADVVSGPMHGTLQLQSDGGFTYTHDGSETTSDSFTYQASDNAGGSDRAVVTLTIRPVNDPPVAIDDVYTLDQGATLTISAPGPLGNDEDPDGGPLTATAITQPLYGTLNLDADGRFTYTHDGSQTTVDSFTYEANDGLGGTDRANVTFYIQQVSIRGDFNGDQIVDVQDVDLLTAEIRSDDPDLRFDLSGDGLVNDVDLEVMIEDVLGTNFGDANLDGFFDSTDMVLVFQVGKYEDGLPGNATWAEGDWNGDADFTSDDMVLAFQSGAVRNRSGRRICPAVRSRDEDAADGFDGGFDAGNNDGESGGPASAHVRDPSIPTRATSASDPPGGASNRIRHAAVGAASRGNGIRARSLVWPDGRLEPSGNRWLPQRTGGSGRLKCPVDGFGVRGTYKPSFLKGSSAMIAACSYSARRSTTWPESVPIAPSCCFEFFRWNTRSLASPNSTPSRISSATRSGSGNVAVRA